MGRRKERRLAAMAAAGRRVKLYLFLDPSPDEENPLALLGQYIDGEEEDEEAADQLNVEIKGSSMDASAQVTHKHDDRAGDKSNAHSELSAPVGVQQEVPQAGDVKKTESVAEENTVASEPTPENECVKAAEAVPDSSGMQIVSDIGGNWKVVMHGQSNLCYYWNTVTGKTSWEIPNELTLGVAADVVTSSVPTHIDYSIEAQAHALSHNSAEAYSSDVSVGNATATCYFGNGMWKWAAYS